MLRHCFLPALLVMLPTDVQAQTTADRVPLAAPVEVLRSMADEHARDAASQRAISTEAWDGALTLTLDLVSRYGERPDHVARLAEIYNRMHRPNDETAAWERFMAVSPHPDRASPKVGRADRGLRDYDAAVHAFLRSLAADPANVKFVYFAGLAYEWAGQLPAARQYYTRATSMAPPGHDYRVSLARLDLHQGNLREARDRAAAVPAQVPTHTEGALVAGLAEQRAGHRDGARKFLELAARLAPQYFDVRLAPGILDYTESRVAQARGHFEAAFLSDPARRAEVPPWLDRTFAPH